MPTPEELADELRDIADRLEDGEYTFTQVSVAQPHQDDSGRFELEFRRTEVLERHAAVLDGESNE